jgi:predicted  nucleic acid-binding Zn-ribbon protein
MAESEKVLVTIQTRVRDLILRFRELKKENEELYTMVDKNEQDIKNLQAEIQQHKRDYESLKMARMIEITNQDLQSSKDRLAKLIRDVDKCIAILSDEK